jgi:fibrillarin-like pre-rRNA processing protein
MKKKFYPSKRNPNNDFKRERPKDSVTDKFFGILEVIKNGRKMICTKNLVPGKQVYGEVLFTINNEEYREWNHRRSKLGAAIVKGIQTTGLKEDSIVLYLGAASGTTVSHISDIASKGFIFALDFAPRVVRDLVYLSEQRKNIAPILGDANAPQTYFHRVIQADMIFQDIAQSNQTEIFLKNIKLFLKKDGIAIIAVKARSVDVSRNPKEIFSEAKKELESELNVLDYRTLDPFERDHCIFICKKK